MNLGADHALGDDLSSAHPLARSGVRHAWFADENDIIISPVPLDGAFLAHIGETLGFNGNSVTVIEAGGVLTDESLGCDDLIVRIRTALGEGGTAELTACFSTPGIAELGRTLLAKGSNAFAAERGADLLNRKTHFRQLAAGISLPLAAGAIATSPAQLAAAIDLLIGATGTVIVKQDNAAGGMGNITVSRCEAGPLPGSRETLPLDTDVQTAAASVWQSLNQPGNRSVVVESYHEATHRFYFEYVIDEAGRPVFLNSGTIRLRPDEDPAARELVWVGLDIPAELPAGAAGVALTHAARLAGRAGEIGYRGYINIDGVRTREGDVIFNEANARWGGGLVLHAIADRLLGRSYADTHCLSSLRDVAAPNRSEAVRRLHRQGLNFSRPAKEGVLVLAADEARPGTAECLVLAGSRERCREIEARARAALADG